VGSGEWGVGSGEWGVVLTRYRIFKKYFLILYFKKYIKYKIKNNKKK
jgi:hypothetical protein